MSDTLREKANKLPLLPGVYIMKDAVGEVIYVGKAKKLKNRVVSYFRGDHDYKTALMVSKAADFDVIIASSEFEALTLENSLIKRHMPKYNILLRDDKGFPFIRLDTKTDYPRFSIVSKIAQDGARYFGPFGKRTVTKDIINTVLMTLKLPTCGKSFPRDIGKERPCLNLHMGTCKGYCQTETPVEEYRQSMNEAAMILDGKTKQLIAELTTRMDEASDNLQFEVAAELRDRVRAVENLSHRQRVITANFADTDAVGYFRGAKCCFTVIHYTEGQLSAKDWELVDDPLETDAEIVSAFVRQYYTRRGAWPKTILLPCDIDDREPLEQMLSNEAGRRVYIEIPKRGDSLQQSKAAMINAREECIRATTAFQRQLKTLEWLQKTLELPSPPERIEAFDVSNTGETGIVAAMVVFRHAKPLKRDYRRFRIKEVIGQDDYGSMREAVTRRYKRYLAGDEGFLELPELLLIDGGHGHAAAAAGVLAELGLEIPVYGMVKDDKHKTRALASPNGDEIGLTGNPAVFALIGTIQEETHRFAIEYHRSLRSKDISSVLDEIKGVGEARRSALLKRFKSLKAIRSASIEELSEVAPKNIAKAVYEYFNSINIDENGDKEES